MTARIVGIGALIVLGALAGALAHLPAAQALAWLAPPGVDAAGVSGSVWSGRAQRVDPGGPTAITGLEWELAPARLLTGWLAGRARFDVGETTVQGHFALGWGRQVAVRDARIKGPAGPLVDLAELPAVAVDGQLLARIEAAVLEGRRPRTLRGRFQWESARLIAPLQLELGDVRGRVEPDEQGGHTLSLSNEGGQVAVEGSLALDAEGRYQADVRLTPRQDAPARIAETLDQFLPRRGGAFVIQRSGRLSAGQ